MNASTMSAETDRGPVSRWLPQKQAHESVHAERMTLVAEALNVFRRRKWLIIACMAIAITVGIIATLLATPRYTASATIEIQRESRNFTMVKGAENSDSDGADMEFYQTQYGLLESKSLAERVVNQLRLSEDASFFQAFDKRHADDWFVNSRVVAKASTRDQRIRAAADALLDYISINPERMSRLVRISFSAPNPAFAKKVVDTWATQFIQQTLARRFDTTSYARRFLEQRLAQLRVRIDQSERQLVDYASRQAIVNLPGESNGSGGTSERPLVVDNLSTLNRALAQATADRIEASSRLDNARGGQSTEALGNSTIAQLRTQRAGLSADYARMMVQFEPGYPPAVALRQQMAQIDAAITREEGRVGGSLRKTYEAATERESRLREQVDTLEQQVLSFRRRSIQYNIYQRDVDTNRQLYDALLQRYKEIGVAGGVGVNNISVVDMSELPTRPSSPRTLVNLALAIAIGMILGCIVAVIVEQVDDRVRNPADIEETFHVPLLGTIPKVRDGEIGNAVVDTKSSLSEAYMSLRARLSFSSDHGVPASLAVTSSQPAEGKSTTSHVLARVLARSGKRVLLIDGDMRSPSIHHMLSLQNQHGLSNYLSGEDDLVGLCHRDATEGLWVMTAGPQPPSAPELLTGDRFGQLLTRARADFDHVVIDAPPVMGLADALLIGNVVEGTMFVFDIRSTSRNTARVAISRLLASQTHVLGIVLTKYDHKSASYGYGYDYSYGDKTA